MEKAMLKGIKARIRNCRRSQGLKREDVADQMNRHVNAYAKWENANDEARLCLQEFLKISEILKVPPTYLLPQNDATREALTEARELTKFLESIRDPLITHVEKLNRRLTNYK